MQSWLTIVPSAIADIEADCIKFVPSMIDREKLSYFHESQPLNLAYLYRLATYLLMQELDFIYKEG